MNTNNIAYMSTQENKWIFTLTSYNFFISTSILTLNEAMIFVIHNRYMQVETSP